MNRCALCPGVNNCVAPTGPIRTDKVFIGEAPGVEEDKKGYPFIGKTGREYNEGHLPAAGLRRDLCYTTNSIKCLPNTTKHKLDIKKKDHLALLESCTNTHLYNEIAQIQPQVVVPMGTFANYAIDPDLNLELHHGIPIQTRLGIPAFPMYHPALGIHEPKKMMMIRTDWIRFKWYLKGTLRLPVDQYPQPDYAEVTDAEEIDALDPDLNIACDTESSRSLGPYVFTYSQWPGVARLIRASRKDLIERLSEKFKQWRAKILFHNWLYDWAVCEDMGLYVPYKLVRDTMIRVFHLGNLPQGLKALAYRELGMFMQDFDDLVTPYSKEYVLDYYRAAYSHKWPKPDEFLYKDDNGLWKVKKPHSIGTKLKGFFTRYNKNPDDETVFDMWDTWDQHHEQVELECGPWPGRDIAHVPFDEMMFYACRDAHATLLLNTILEQMARLVRKSPQEEWRLV